jgi:hypothetical protein
MNHPQKIERYYGTHWELAEDIGNLDYDALVELFDLLSKKFQKDSQHDKELWHPQVSEKLENISRRLKEILEEEIRPLANVCREYNQKGIK